MLRRRWLLTTLLLLLPVLARGAPEGDPLEPKLHRHILANGLGLIVVPDEAATAAAVALAIRVGSWDERPGQSGFAHLFEHLMFQGSANAPKGEHMRIIAAAGGDVNAYTTFDHTLYYDVVPPDRLAQALWLEADRLRALALTREALRNQVATVREELRERVENAPYVPAMLRLQELLFSNWANAHPTIGNHTDLEKATLSMAAEFFERHYVPTNMVLVVAGAVEPDRTKQLVERYFGRLEPVIPPERPDTTEPPRSEAVVERMADPHASRPALFMGWQGPPRNHADYHAMALLGAILGGSESSRLYRTLVQEKQLAASVSAGSEGRLAPDPFQVVALLNERELGLARKAVETEVVRVQQELVADEELERVRNSLEAAFVFRTRTAAGRAQLLASLALVYGKPTTFRAELERYRAVTTEDIRRAARTYLTPERMAVVEVVPKEVQ